MGQKLQLFNGGYAGAVPIFYFGLHEALQVHFNSISSKIPENIASVVSRVKAEAVTAGSALCDAEAMAGKFSLSLPQKPVDLKTYLTWQKEFVSQIERIFPLSRIEYYYFLYGRKLAELCSLSAAASALIHLRQSAEAVEDIDYRIDSCLKDCEFGLFKLTAASALLAGEPRHSYFMTGFRQLNDAYLQCKQASQKLSPETSPGISGELQAYADTVCAAYNRCKLLLEDLDV